MCILPAIEAAELGLGYRRVVLGVAPAAVVRSNKVTKVGRDDLQPPGC